MLKKSPSGVLASLRGEGFCSFLRTPLCADSKTGWLVMSVGTRVVKSGAPGSPLGETLAA
jgi:hypothetical protein